MGKDGVRSRKTPVRFLSHGSAVKHSTGCKEQSCLKCCWGNKGLKWGNPLLGFVSGVFSLQRMLPSPLVAVFAANFNTWFRLVLFSGMHTGLWRHRAEEKAMMTTARTTSPPLLWSGGWDQFGYNGITTARSIRKQCVFGGADHGGWLVSGALWTRFRFCVEEHEEGEFNEKWWCAKRHRILSGLVSFRKPAAGLAPQDVAGWPRFA